VYADIPPPCIHGHDCVDHPATAVSSSKTLISDHHQPPAQQSPVQHAGYRAAEPVPLATPSSSSRMHRQKSVSRRMLSRVKQGIGNRSKSSHSVRPTESDSSLVRRLSGRRRPSRDIDTRAHSFEVARASVDSIIDETPEPGSFMPSTIQRSFTSSTVSTTEALGDRSTSNTPDLPRHRDHLTNAALSPIRSCSPPPPQTPRPPPKSELPALPKSTSVSLQVPCIELYVALSSCAVDLHSKHDIWVAVEATVRPMSTTIETNAVAPDISHAEAGSVSTLRLCFKPMGGCSIREVLGQKTYRDLKMGQQCSLFLKVHVPRVRIRDSSINPDQESLMADLESMIGTLKMEVLHVEARYRHTLLPSDNVVTVRHICKIKRPKTESRWSIVGITNDTDSSSDVHGLLAQYLAATYSATDALEMLQKHIDHNAGEQPMVRHIRESLVGRLQAHDQHRSESVNPSVVVTDSDLNIAACALPLPDPYPTAPSTPAAEDDDAPPGLSITTPKLCPAKQASSVHLPSCAPPMLSTAKTTACLTDMTHSISYAAPTEAEDGLEHSDSARQLWRHIRRTSLSTKQLEELTTRRLTGQLEPRDETVDELRRKALANKRSVGAETLRSWKWDESLAHDYKTPESPWM